MRKNPKPKNAPPLAVTAEERCHLINDAAYFRALKHRQETGTPEAEAGSWQEVESEIDGVLKKHHADDQGR